MKIAIVYDSVTGNTKKLADVIYDECMDFEVNVYTDFCDDILNADLIFIGSWTFKGEPSDKMKNVYQRLNNKRIFVFGTCGFGGSLQYYKMIFENTCKYINSNNGILDYYFCPGKLPDSIKEKYEKNLENNPNDEKIRKMINNFNVVLKRPNDEDLNELRDKVRKVIDESQS